MDGKGCLLALNCYFVLPAVGFFTVAWFLFGAFSDSPTKYWTTLIGCLLYIVVSIFLGFKYVYNIAKKDSSSRDKKIFFIGITILIIALVVLFKIYVKR